MRFTLIDRIVELQPGQSITAVKALSLAEEYLADHFPKFPVLPGVLMLEAMTQAAAWLVRATEDFAHSMVVLKEAANVKYGQFVKPGQILTVTAEVAEHNERETRFKAQGRVDGRVKVSGRLVLERYNLADANPDRAFTDEVMVRELRELYQLLYQVPQPAAGANGRQGAERQPSTTSS